MKVVLTNSIGVNSRGFYIIHSPSRWSCAVKDKQSWFAYYPWELAYLSSLLKRETGLTVKLLDGCLNRDNSSSLFNRISNERPDWLVMECSSMVFSENLALAKRIKDTFGTRLIFAGQHASAFPGELIKEGVDYVCTGEYENSVLDILKAAPISEIEGVYPNKRRKLLSLQELPWPEDEDVSRLSYAYPGEPSSEFIEIQMYATRGCLRRCNFCVASHVYYDGPNYRLRKIDDIIDEIKYLMDKYPLMEGVFFDEEVHNAKRDFTISLCDAIIENGLNRLHFEAMCDIQLFDAEILKQMKRAGYYKIRFGIESSSEIVMRSIGKLIPKSLLMEALKEVKSYGLKTYGAFTFGALNSTKAEDLKTITLIRHLIREGLLDNLQISICTPQPGTPFYEFINKKGYLATEDFSKFDGGNFSVVDYPDYKKEEIEKSAELGFLIRDHCYLWRRLSKNQLFGWFLDIYRKYGFLSTVRKILKRIKREIRFFNIQICQRFL